MIPTNEVWKERLKDPIYAQFVGAFLIYNYDLTIKLLDLTIKSQVKIEAIKKLSFVDGFIAPVLLVVLINLIQFLTTAIYHFCNNVKLSIANRMNDFHETKEDILYKALSKCRDEKKVIHNITSEFIQEGKLDSLRDLLQDAYISKNMTKKETITDAVRIIHSLNDISSRYHFKKSEIEELNKARLSIKIKKAEIRYDQLIDSKN